jgi:hypothetical protein
MDSTRLLSEIPFGFAVSKIPTSRAKDAREIGHPDFLSSRVGRCLVDTQGSFRAAGNGAGHAIAPRGLV